MSGGLSVQGGRVMDTSSIVLLSLLGGAMLLFVIHNVKYNKSRDRAYQAYRKAVGILSTEFEYNLDVADKARNAIAIDSIPKCGFKTEVGAALLKEPFLEQMDRDASNDISHIYNLIGKAETYRSQLIEASSQQLASAGSGQRVEDCRTSLSRTLDELSTKMHKHLARVGKMMP
jgi:hypothetical protein